LSFHRHFISSRFSEASSSSSTIDLGRISKIPSVINIPYHTNLPRKSTSDIPSTSFQNADYTTNIPKPVYIDLEQPSPPTSPTFSTITENIQNELNVLTLEKHFIIHKSLLKRDFYSDHNREKRFWFFQHFLQQRDDIQKQFYAYIETHNVQILFFDWFAFHYALAQHITYPFTSIKHACPITTRSKTPIWTLTSGSTVESDHPPLRNIQLTHKDQTVDAAPYKLPGEDTLTNTKHIIQQNNFTNTNLHTIGKQLTRLEKQIQKTLAQLITDKNPIDLKLKNLVFKPYQVTQTSQAQIQENQTDFLRAIKIHLQNLDRTSLTVPDTPQQSNPSSFTNQVNTLQSNPVSTSDTETFQAQPLQLNRLTWLAPKTTIAPDISISTKPIVISEHKYNASSLYEWNIDGMSEYNILNTLQQMTMTANAYKTQTGTSDKAIAELLIVGFSGQFKGWWDYHLTETDHLHITNSIQTYEDQTPILDPSGNTIQDAVSTLILTISLHFVGDPSHLKDKNAELLSNLRCKKLSDFQWYKNTFLTQVMLREDSNQPFWKKNSLQDYQSS